MRQTRINVLLFTCLLFSFVSYAQPKKTVVDYLDIPGPIAFDGKSYSLSWTSHPVGNYYKQEYIVKGDNADKFNTMLMVEIVTDNDRIKEVAGAKIAELKKLKETNPMVNYDSFDNPKTGEIMIDFLLSQNTADGKDISVVERNVYRYLPFVGKDGKKGIMLFGVSTRSYGNKIQTFLTSLKAKKSELVNKVAQFKIPDAKIVK